MELSVSFLININFLFLEEAAGIVKDKVVGAASAVGEGTKNLAEAAKDKGENHIEQAKQYKEVAKNKLGEAFDSASKFFFKSFPSILHNLNFISLFLTNRKKFSAILNKPK